LGFDEMKGSMLLAEVDRNVFVIFGGTGDLARRKLIPALYDLIRSHGIGTRCVLLGVASRDLDDDDYRTWVKDALRDMGIDDADLRAWCDENVFYQRLGRGFGTFESLGARLELIEAEREFPGNRIFYLALPPAVFPRTITGLGDSGLNESSGWTRLVIEKPIGDDLASALALNTLVHDFFDESQVYRIDHYLGKETVQNLLAFRFSNPMFESVWNRDRVESVEITVAEDLGIGSRAGYYESAGVMRDMVQNHLTQVLALVAMEPPISFDAEQIRNEKVKVIEAIAPIRRESVVLGQYDPGSIAGVGVQGYRDEDGVDVGSRTATFVGVELRIDTWRWQGVPFFLRTGKRLPKRLTEIAVTFQRPPLCIVHGRRDSCIAEPNILLITLQPDEGFALRFNVKAPGDTVELDSQALRFSHDQAYGHLPEAYETLILDVMEGDQTLFVRSDEVEASWRIYDPLLDYRPEPHRYEAGTWGPGATNRDLKLGETPWTAVT
jgi:glucose-6-phosphate 1-dehydrogenase